MASKPESSAKNETTNNSSTEQPVRNTTSIIPSPVPIAVQYYLVGGHVTLSQHSSICWVGSSAPFLLFHLFETQLDCCLPFLSFFSSLLSSIFELSSSRVEADAASRGLWAASSEFSFTFTCTASNNIKQMSLLCWLSGNVHSAICWSDRVGVGSFSAAALLGLPSLPACLVD